MVERNLPNRPAKPARTSELSTWQHLARSWKSLRIGDAAARARQLELGVARGAAGDVLDVTSTIGVVAANRSWSTSTKQVRESLLVQHDLEPGLWLPRLILSRVVMRPDAEAVETFYDSGYMQREEIMQGLRLRNAQEFIDQAVAFQHHFKPIEPPMPTEVV
jgi:hypothetical protein